MSLSKKLEENQPKDDEAADESFDGNDDLKTLLNDGPTTLMYLRDEGILEGSTVFDGEDSLKVPGASHHRSVSNDQHLKTHLSQLQYNNNRVALDRSIHSAVQLLAELQSENRDRPIFYPTSDIPNSLLNSRKAHLALIRKNSTQTVKSLQKEKESDERDEDDKPLNLNILNLSVKLDHNQIAKLDKSAIGHLLDEKLSQVSRHLSALKERIDDTSSKVFVTGDLNSGKSTFCNALLRRRVLPEDQQPCTTVFCEVIDSRENNGIEEVHAVPIGSKYNIKDESSYKVFLLKDLEALVGECDKYSILKVYVTDKRNVNESLLRNGVVDIALIDAPGLNMDSYQTTEVFSRQEEIDLVVFVLSAENHFTLSAKEFIAAAANEKKLIFIVVNRFDQIKDKNKCMNRILDQVQQLSPDTHKDARNFVHFVSSSGIVERLPIPGSNDGDSGESGSSGGLPNHDRNDDDDDYSTPDFDHLEESLRNFVLQKRALSKLQPAKTYLNNLFSDIEELSNVNQKLYLSDKETLVSQLNEIAPAYESNLVESTKAHSKIEDIIENTSQKIYDYTRTKINSTLENVGDNPVVPYEGISHLFEYIVDTQAAITKNIIQSVTESEAYARIETVESVNRINHIGKEALGDEIQTEKVFREEFMFTRRRDTISRNIDDSVSIMDFFDPSFEGFLSAIGVHKQAAGQLLIWKNSLYSVGLYAASKFVTTGNVVKGVFHYGSFFSLSTLRLIAIPISIGAAAVGITYLVKDIPNALPRNLARKIRIQIQQLDYPHQNSERISKECRKILKIPAREVQNSFQSSLDRHASKKEKILSSIKDADIASSVFGKLLKRAVDQKRLVESYDLETISQVE